MIAVCQTFKVSSISFVHGLVIQQICKRPEVVARAAILRRWKEPTGIISMGEFCNLEIAVLNAETMGQLADFFATETGDRLTYEECL